MEDLNTYRRSIVRTKCTSPHDVIVTVSVPLTAEHTFEIRTALPDLSVTYVKYARDQMMTPSVNASNK
jgi:hypothetical protein